MVKVITNSQGKVYTSNGKALVSTGGSPTPSGKYQLLDRVTDDSNNEIGTVSGFFTDANNIEYAVVCLDSQYRDTMNISIIDGYDANFVTNLPIYGLKPDENFIFNAQETGTFNTQKILDFCSNNELTSSMCSFCRSKSFIIDNTTYYGQVPNIIEMQDILKNAYSLDNLDGSQSIYVTTYGFSSTDVDFNFVSSTQGSYYEESKFWFLSDYGIYMDSSSNSLRAIPIIEIPN